MKILAVVDATSYKRSYIASVTHAEIAAVFDKRQSDLKQLNTDDDVDLSGGHRFRDDIKRACEGMTEAIERFEKARATLMAFAVMVSNLPPELQPEAKDGAA